MSSLSTSAGPSKAVVLLLPSGSLGLAYSSSDARAKVLPSAERHVRTRPRSRERTLDRRSGRTSLVETGLVPRRQRAPWVSQRLPLPTPADNRRGTRSGSDASHSCSHTTREPRAKRCTMRQGSPSSWSSRSSLMGVSTKLVIAGLRHAGIIALPRGRLKLDIDALEFPLALIRRNKSWNSASMLSWINTHCAVGNRKQSFLSGQVMGRRGPLCHSRRKFNPSVGQA